MQNSEASLPPVEASFEASWPSPPAVPTDEPNAYLGQTFRFQFRGNAREYFGIWIVNILLTIVTFSLYAPWAKVRRLRYFYGNTVFYRRKFDFTGVPTRILIGRIIALGVYFGASALAQVSWQASLIGFLIIFLLVPWLVRSTIRFRARNSKFGNSRFYFTGTTKEAYILALKGILIYIFTLGIFFPVLFWYFKKYTLDNLQLGQLRFELHADWPDYMRAMYVPVFLFIGIVFVLGLFVAFTLQVGSSSPTQFGIIVAVIYMIAAFMIWPLMMARIFITTWNKATLGRSPFQTDCGQMHYAWIVMTNWILKILSLGLLSAWAAVRLYQYQIESLTLTLKNDPDRMYNLAQDDPNAIAEELSDIFDIDISL